MTPDGKKKKTAQQIAEDFMKSWHAVKPRTQDPAKAQPPDATVPDIASLKRKYFGPQADNVDDAADDAANSADGDDEVSGLVPMEQNMPTDDKAGRKTVVVDRGRVRGVQG
jgi:hypothetical protein